MLSKSVVSITTILTMVFFISGCNADGVQAGDIGIGKNSIQIPSAISITTGSKSSAGESGNVGSSFQCTSNNPNAIVTGTNREVTITGKCSSIRVDGANLDIVAEQTNSLIESGKNNDIEISLVNSITVNGSNSDVSYDSNFYQNPAQVSVTGSNSDVEQNE